MENALYNYMFHFNHHTGYWNAFARDNYLAYWDGDINAKDVFKSKNILTLIELLTRGEKFIKTIK